MNTHPVTSEDVMAYLDGELSPKDAAEMAIHLAQCRTCQDTAADLQSVSRQLAGWTVEATEADGIPASIATALEVRAAGKANPPASNWSWLLAHPRWTLAATPLVVVVLALMFHSGSEMRRVSMVKSLSSVPLNGRGMSSLTSLAPEQGTAIPQAAPAIVRTAELRVTARNFDTLRGDLDRIVLQFGGHIAELNVTSPSGESRSLTAVLRVPAPQLEAFLGELRKLGRVDGESQRGEEVSQQAVDLDARLANARHTEQRLTEILRTQTGKLADVLAVEEKLAEVRGMIEQAEAEQKSLNNRITLATVSLNASEDYRNPLSTSLGTAAVDGVRIAFNGTVEFVHALLEAGPSLLLFAVIFGLPAYFLWKKFGR
jgi:anti-sigma factor RsiW